MNDCGQEINQQFFFFVCKNAFIQQNIINNPEFSLIIAVISICK